MCSELSNTIIGHQNKLLELDEKINAGADGKFETKKVEDLFQKIKIFDDKISKLSMIAEENKNAISILNDYKSLPNLSSKQIAYIEASSQTTDPSIDLKILESRTQINEDKISEFEQSIQKLTDFHLNVNYHSKDYDELVQRINSFDQTITKFSKSIVEIKMDRSLITKNEFPYEENKYKESKYSAEIYNSSLFNSDLKKLNSEMETLKSYVESLNQNLILNKAEIIENTEQNKILLELFNKRKFKMELFEEKIISENIISNESITNSQNTEEKMKKLEESLRNLTHHVMSKVS
jgi:hypothetical protein